MTTPIVNVADVVLEARPQAFAPSGAAAERFNARIGCASQSLDYWEGE